jgi:hypothetical protein
MEYYAGIDVSLESEAYALWTQQGASCARPRLDFPLRLLDEPIDIVIAEPSLDYKPAGFLPGFDQPIRGPQ